MCVVVRCAPTRCVHGDLPPPDNMTFREMALYNMLHAPISIDCIVNSSLNSPNNSSSSSMVDMVRIDSSSSLFFLQTCSYISSIKIHLILRHKIHRAQTRYRTHVQLS